MDRLLSWRWSREEDEEDASGHGGCGIPMFSNYGSGSGRCYETIHDDNRNYTNASNKSNYSCGPWFALDQDSTTTTTTTTTRTLPLLTAVESTITITTTPPLSPLRMDNCASTSTSTSTTPTSSRTVSTDDHDSIVESTMVMDPPSVVLHETKSCLRSVEKQSVYSRPVASPDGAVVVVKSPTLDTSMLLALLSTRRRTTTSTSTSQATICSSNNDDDNNNNQSRYNSHGANASDFSTCSSSRRFSPFPVTNRTIITPISASSSPGKAPMRVGCSSNNRRNNKQSRYNSHGTKSLAIATRSSSQHMSPPPVTTRTSIVPKSALSFVSSSGTAPIRVLMTEATAPTSRELPPPSQSPQPSSPRSQKSRVVLDALNQFVSDSSGHSYDTNNNDDDDDGRSNEKNSRIRAKDAEQPLVPLPRSFSIADVQDGGDYNDHDESSDADHQGDTNVDDENGSSMTTSSSSLSFLSSSTYYSITSSADRSFCRYCPSPTDDDDDDGCSGNRLATSTNDDVKALVVKTETLVDSSHKQHLQLAQLSALIHAASCYHNPVLSDRPCPGHACCSALKRLWRHIQTCGSSKGNVVENGGGGCEVPGCAKYRTVWQHFVHCRDSHCRLCTDAVGTRETKLVLRRQYARTTSRVAAGRLQCFIDSNLSLPRPPPQYPADQHAQAPLSSTPSTAPTITGAATTTTGTAMTPKAIGSTTPPTPDETIGELHGTTTTDHSDVVVPASETMMTTTTTFPMAVVNSALIAGWSSTETVVFTSTTITENEKMTKRTEPRGQHRFTTKVIPATTTPITTTPTTTGGTTQPPHHGLSLPRTREKFLSPTQPNDRQNHHGNYCNATSNNSKITDNKTDYIAFSSPPWSSSSASMSWTVLTSSTCSSSASSPAGWLSSPLREATLGLPALCPKRIILTSQRRAATVLGLPPLSPKRSILTSPSTKGVALRLPPPLPPKRPILASSPKAAAALAWPRPLSPTWAILTRPKGAGLELPPLSATRPIFTSKPKAAAAALTFPPPLSSTRAIVTTPPPNDTGLGLPPLSPTTTRPPIVNSPKALLSSSPRPIVATPVSGRSRRTLTQRQKRKLQGRKGAFVTTRS